MPQRPKWSPNYGAGAKGTAANSGLQDMDAQLESLREAVKKERQKRASMPTGTIWNSSQKGAGVAVKKGPTRAQGRIAQRLSDACSAVPSVPDAVASVKSEEAVRTLQRIQEFDLFGGAIDPGALESSPSDDIEPVGEYLVKAKEELKKDFEEIEAYRYDEREERRRHYSSLMQDDPAPPSVQASPPKPPPQDGTPRRPKVKDSYRTATSSSSSSSSSFSSSSSPSASQPSSKDGIWGIYDLRSEGKMALKSWKTSTAAAPAKSSQKPQPQPPSDPPAPSKEAQSKQLRMQQLQAILVSPPPEGADPAEHYEKQRMALEELQKLQRTIQINEAHSTPLRAPSSLLSGEVNEEENRRAFQEAVMAWRNGGSEAGPGKEAQTKEAATTGPPLAPLTPFAGKKGRAFLAGLEEATQFVYFDHLFTCFQASMEKRAAAAFC